MFDGGLLNGFVELNTSSEAASCATTEKCTNILWNLKVNYCEEFRVLGCDMLLLLKPTFRRYVSFQSSGYKESTARNNVSYLLVTANVVPS
jgi:hypothetical protein